MCGSNKISYTTPLVTSSTKIHPPTEPTSHKKFHIIKTDKVPQAAPYFEGRGDPPTYEISGLRDKIYDVASIV